MSDPVTYTGVLPIGEYTAVHLARLLARERRERRTRHGRRALGPWRHAVLVLRWFLDGTRVGQLAVDNQISLSTAYRYLHEGHRRPRRRRTRPARGVARGQAGRDTPTSAWTAPWSAPTAARPPVRR